MFGDAFVSFVFNVDFLVTNTKYAFIITLDLAASVAASSAATFVL